MDSIAKYYRELIIVSQVCDKQLHYRFGYKRHGTVVFQPAIPN